MPSVEKARVEQLIEHGPEIETPPEFQQAVPVDNPALSTPRHPSPVGEMGRRYAIAIALIALIVVFSIIRTKTFFTLDNARTILTTEAPLLLLSTGLTYSLGAGEFDLSIGGVIDLVVVLLPWFALHSHLNVGVVMIGTVVIAVAVGLANGFFVTRQKVNSFILTLASGTVLTGIALGISASETLNDVPKVISSVFGGYFLGVGYGFWYALIIAAVTFYVMEFRVGGRHIYFTGESEEVARLCGISTKRVKSVCFIATSIIAAIAAFVILGQTGAGSANLGDAYTLNAFATVFLGMTVAKVGRVNVVGTWLAVLLIGVGSTGLQLLGLQAWVTDVFSGVVLIVALSAASAARRPDRRVNAKSRQQTERNGKSGKKEESHD